MMNIVYGGDNHEQYNYQTQAATMASCYALFAQRLKDQGVNIKYWSPFNESNSDGRSAVDCGNVLAHVKPALKAVDQNYLVGGGDFSFADTPYISAMASNGAEFINWHGYFENATEYADDDCLNQKALEFAAAPTNGSSSPLSTFRTQQPGVDPLMMHTEWNFNFAVGAFNNNGDPRQRTFFGGIFHAIVRCNSIYGGYAGSAHWHIEDPDGTYPIFGPGPSYSYFSPAYLIQALNTYMPVGYARPVTLNFAGGNGRMSAVCVSDGTKFGFLIINRNTGNSAGNDGSVAGVTWNGTVTLTNRTSTAPITKWVYDRNNPNGLATQVTPTGAPQTLSVSIPGPGLVILSGTAVESPTGTQLTSAEGVIVDQAGNIWTLVPGTNGLVATKNGVAT